MPRVSNEEENRIMVATPVPGMEPANIHIEVDGHQLVMDCEQRGPGQDRTKHYVVREWSVGPYHRIVTLPRTVDVAHANATYDNGVLVVILPESDIPTAGIVVMDKVGTAKGQAIGHAGKHPVPAHRKN